MLAACGLTSAVTASMVGASACLLQHRKDAVLDELRNLHHVARSGRKGMLDAIQLMRSCFSHSPVDRRGRGYLECEKRLS